MYYYGPAGMNGYGWFGGAILGLVWLIFMVVIVIFLVRLFKHHEYGHFNNANEPMEIARQRYAKGEINKEEFEQLKKDLK